MFTGKAEITLNYVYNIRVVININDQLSNSNNNYIGILLNCYFLHYYKLYFIIMKMKI